LSAEDRVMINRAIKIGEKRVSDVMLPRTDIVGIEVDAPIEEIRDAFLTSGYSRLPVYQEHLDQVVGIVYVLDFLSRVRSIRSQLRPALFIPESMKAIDALNRLRREKRSIAVVIDEHGGTAGLVTLEDIVEILLGSIVDEFDLETEHIRAVAKHEWIASGRVDVDNLREQLGLNIPEGDYVTLGGFLEHTLGAIPRCGQRVTPPGWLIEVIHADVTKVVEVRIRKFPTAPTAK